MAKNLISIIKSINSEHTTEAVQIAQFLDLLNIEATFGANLDVIGAIVGEYRKSGDGDGSYREKLKTKIALNVASGNREIIIQSALHYTNATSVLLYESGANIVLTLAGTTDIPTQDQVNRIKQQVASGVGLYIIYVPTDPFQYDTGLGYDDGEYSFLVGNK